GTHRLHVAVERAVADWMRVGGVRLFNSGYAANTGVLSTLAGPGDVVFSDELNHASIIDGCRLSRAEVVVYPHGDLRALEEVLARRGGHRRRLVVTESLFSMDGDLADLAAISRLCAKHEAALVVDEAHAVGVHGPEGRGLAADVAVTPDVLIGTFGKALGTYGAFAATTAPIAELLWNRARSLVFSTALPPSIPAATLAAIEVVRSDEGRARRRALAGHARRLRELVPCLGGAAESAIAPLAIGDDREVMQTTARLLERGVFVQGIRPPTVPAGTARLRVSLCAGLSTQQLETSGLVMNDATRQRGCT
ncbi:MAG TPA: aminotransferase class I/II-fold pyridoxal phosphate-dependent enzyme, partial [Kofleriaceae bacterium]|nr:aminotransferase class I/II-fold pyridoxal phosphate-dependent enzyme [Kofleriaceae bacterium]